MIAQQETTPTQVFKEFILVPHTHWDREWYLTFQQFRAKLVDLFDQLLELLNADPQYPAFTLDGQTIMLEDYLAVRPERRGELAQRIAQGRLLVGPWYVMPDEFLVSPEAIVRNLLLGRRLAQEFGGGMDVGYVPDPFGHIAQLPQILQGFGIDCALFMRGMGDEGEALGDVFLWEAPDGSAVLAHHQLTSYGNAANLPLDPDLAARLVRNVATRMARLAVTPVLLLNNGSDHLRPQPALRRIVQELEQRLDRHVEFGSHRAYIERVKAHRPALKRFRGELRGGRYAMLLPSVLSTRMYLKQANHQVQTALERWAEPVAALAWALGHRYPAGLLQEAWRLVLQNHPHDSICGCSIDQVHREMLPRLDQAEQIAELVSERAMQQVTQALNTAQLQDNGTALVVYNPSNWRRSDGLETVLHLAEEEAREFHIVDPTTGQCLPHQVLEISRDVPFEGREDKLNLPRRLEQMKDRMGLRRYEIRREGTTVYLDLAWGVPRTPDDTWDALIADATKQVLGDPSVQHFHLTGKRTAVRIFLANSDLPLLGYRTYVLRPGPAPAVDSTLRAGERQLENESLRVEVANNGTLTITDLASGTVHRGCHLFEHIADAGDEYTFSPAQGATALTSAAAQAQVSLVETGPARATLQIKVDLQLPLGLTAQRRPNRRRVKYPVTSYVSLVPGSRRVEIRTTLTNTAQDHRLRVLFSTGLVAQEVTVDGHFCTLQRPVDPPAGTGWVEQPSRTNHQMAFVDVSDGQRGFALLNRGLPEYEAIREANGQITLALTLLRCVGYLSRPDLLNRPGNAGPGFAAPGAQCPGQHTFHYAIYLHQGTWEQGVLPEAHSFNQPLRATLATKQQGTLPLEQSFLQVEPEQLVVSALKRAEHGQGLILRVYNPTNQAVPARLRWFQPLNAVTEARLDETPLGPATMAADGTFTCTIGAQQVKSFELHRS